MKSFNEWYKNIEKEYPLCQDKDGYSIGNTKALMAGWKAALEWFRERTEDFDHAWAIQTIIDKELEE